MKVYEFDEAEICELKKFHRGTFSLFKTEFKDPEKDVILMEISISNGVVNFPIFIQMDEQKLDEAFNKINNETMKEASILAQKYIMEKQKSIQVPVGQVPNTKNDHRKGLISGLMNQFK